MTVTVTVSFTRPSTETTFYAPTVDVVSHWHTAYVSTGMLVSRSDTVSQDGLTRTIVNVWKDQASLDAWRADPIRNQLMSARAAYHATKKVTESDTTTA